MRTILINEICNEKPNSAALGAFNSVLSYSEYYGGKTNTFKIEKNQYGVKVAVRYTDGIKTNYSAPINTIAKNIKFQ